MKITEYRGAEGLVYAKVTKDDNEPDGGYETGEVKPLAGVSTISKTTETSSESKFYDNIAAIVINSTGTDTVTCDVSALPLETLADITGQEYDAETGTMIEGSREENYFALGYRTKKTDGTEVLVWRYKGTFGIPDVTHVTENNGTDSNGQQIVYTGISTTHKFTKTGKPAKAINVDIGLDLVDTTNFFNKVTTPDEVQAKAKTMSAAKAETMSATKAESK